MATGDNSDFLPAGADGYPVQLTTIAARYQIERVVGTGGMARVYLALDQKMKRQVAIKILQRGLNDTEERRHRFTAEIDILASVNVEGVIDVYDRGEFAGWLWYAMPYIDGKELDDYLDHHDPRLDHRLKMASRVARAIAGLHASGLEHRDLKPENILVGPQGLPLVMDFGIAKWVATERRLDLTREGVTPGTPLYMAPERFTPNRDSSDGRASDVYSLGLILYEILTGEYAFRTKDVGLTEHVLRVMEGTIEPISELNPEVPEPVVAIVTRALAPEVEDRPSADELASLLEQALHDVRGVRSDPKLQAIPLPPAIARAAAPQPPAAPAPPTRPVRLPLLILGVVVMLAGLVVGGWHLSRPGPPPDGVSYLYVQTSIGDADFPGATVSFDGKEVIRRSPARVPVKYGTAINLVAHYRHGDEFYRSNTRRIEVNWSGESTVDLPLYLRADAPAAPATSAPTPAQSEPQMVTFSDLDMPFIWVPQLNCWVGKYEVTNAQYRARSPDFSSGEMDGYDAEGNATTFSLNEDQQPALGMSWADALAYADWLTAREIEAKRIPANFSLRLPTEAEWQYVASYGQTHRKYPWGNDGDIIVGNYHGEEGLLAGRSSDGLQNHLPSHNDGHPVSCDVSLSGSNDWGFFGLGGNVYEMCGSNDDPRAFGGWHGGSFLIGSWTGMRIDHSTGAADMVGTACGLRLVLVGK